VELWLTRQSLTGLTVELKLRNHSDQSFVLAHTEDLREARRNEHSPATLEVGGGKRIPPIAYGGNMPGEPTDVPRAGPPAIWHLLPKSEFEMQRVHFTFPGSMEKESEMVFRWTGITGENGEGPYDFEFVLTP
jgi:hypothetical protein